MSQHHRERETMRWTIVTLSLLTLLAAPARGQDAHSHQARHGDRPLMGKVTSVEGDRIRVATDEGKKDVVLRDNSGAGDAAGAAKSDLPLQKGDEVTVHGAMTAEGDFEAREIYRGRCGQREDHCRRQDLAWSHRHRMDHGQRMGHEMMNGHKQRRR